MAAADPAGAFAEYLKATPAVDGLVSGRVYRPDLDADEASSMPQAAIVIRRAGGYQMFGAANVPVGDPRLDVFCYGETYLDADNVAAAVILAAKQLRGGTYHGTRLYWARIEGGPIPAADPDTHWPMTILTVQLAHCEQAVT